MLSRRSFVRTERSMTALCCVLTASSPPRSVTSSSRHFASSLATFVRRSSACTPRLLNAAFCRESPCLEYSRRAMRFAFAGSFGVFIVICSFIINSYVGNNGDNIYLNTSEDESLLTNLDESISLKTPESLDIYGPWDDLEN